MLLHEMLVFWHFNTKAHLETIEKLVASVILHATSSNPWQFRQLVDRKKVPLTIKNPVDFLRLLNDIGEQSKSYI